MIDFTLLAIDAYLRKILKFLTIQGKAHQEHDIPSKRFANDVKSIIFVSKLRGAQLRTCVYLMVCFRNILLRRDFTGIQKMPDLAIRRSRQTRGTSKLPWGNFVK